MAVRTAVAVTTLASFNLHHSSLSFFVHEHKTCGDVQTRGTSTDYYFLPFKDFTHTKVISG